MGTQKFNISFIIGAVDNVTMKVMEINDKIQKSFAPFQKVGQAFGLLGAELGLNKIGKALGDVGEKGKAVFNELIAAGIKFAAVLGTVGAAFRYVVMGAAQSANEIRDASERIGISTESFQTLQYAATQSGVELSKLEPVLTKFSQTLGNASEGNNEAAQIFKALGVNIKDSKGHLLSMDEVLPKLADRLSKIENPSVRNAIAMKLFGKEGVRFAQILQGGSEGLEAFKKRAQELGLVLDKDMIDKGAALNNQFEEVELVFSRLRDAVGAELFPVMKQFLTQITEIFVQNRPAIVAFAKSFAEDLPGILKSLADLFVALGAALKPVVVIFQVVTSIFGTANTVFAILAAVITGRLIFAIYALMGALIKLGLISATTPIGLIAIAIGAVILAIMALIRYWTPISEFFKNMSTGWSLLLRGILLLMGPFGWLAAIGLTIYRNWEKIVDLFGAVGDKFSAVKGFLGFGDAAGANAAGASGPPLNVGQSVSDIQNAENSSKSTENRVVVDFNNLPQGTKIKTEKSESPMDLNLGYGMATP